jgi:hypothetical protein
MTWVRPIHAAGRTDFIYRTGFANTVVATEEEGVRKHFPGFRRLPSLHGGGVWRGQLRPIAQTYEVRVEMAVGCADAHLVYPWRATSVRVLDGAIRPAPGGTWVPHLYGPWDDPRGADLCLYYPPDETLPLGHEVAERLLPWAYEWLYYYEMWLVTGTWSGPEAPHAPGDRPSLPNCPLEKAASASVLRKFDEPVMRSMSYVIGRQHPVREDVMAKAA